MNTGTYTRKALHILGLTALVVVAAGVANAINFTHSGSSPTNANVAKPINTGSDNQVKSGGLSVRDLTATKVTGQNQICIGGDCRNAWPTTQASQFSTSCRMHTLTIADGNNQPGLPHNANNLTRSQLAQNCDGLLSSEERNLGFMMISFDNCPTVSGRDCAGPSYCKYIRFECDAGITFREGSFTIGAPTNEQACEDGIDNDGDGFIDLEDFGCTSPQDNSEENEADVLLR